MTENNLVTKVWNYATILKDSGVVYMDYVAQLTYLLFLKMDDERTSSLGEESLVPAEYVGTNSKDSPVHSWNSNITKRYPSFLK